MVLQSMSDVKKCDNYYKASQETCCNVCQISPDVTTQIKYGSV